MRLERKMDRIEEDVKAEWYEQPRALLIFAGLIAATLGIYFLCMKAFYPEPNDMGQFGDAFGATNALFSGMAFAGVIVALFMQRRELQLQRRQLQLQKEELELTRLEVTRSADAHQESAMLLRKQFELNQPLIQLACVGKQSAEGSETKLTIETVNSGGAASNLSFKSGSGLLYVGCGRQSRVSQDGTMNIHLRYRTRTPGTFTFEFRYLDNLGEGSTQMYSFEYDEKQPEAARLYRLPKDEKLEELSVS